MRRFLGLWPLAAMWGLACAVAGSPAGETGDKGEDADVVAQDASDGASREADLVLPQDDGLAPDVPMTCEEVLEKGQCISTCPDWMACLGVGGCEEPPCWGLCQDYPGTCLPLTAPALCTKDDDCGDGAVCAGRVQGAGGEVGLPGLCRSRPSPDACYEDSHCPSGQRCAGAARCTIEAPCLGPEYPGRCVLPPPAGGCWDDADCPEGQRCRGAVLCLAGDKACSTDIAGACEAKTGCLDDQDCSGSPDGPYCVGAFRCRPDAQCAFPDVAGFCAPPPGLRRCWQQDHCGGDWVCRAALLCPLGTLCQTSGAAVRGLCGEAPAPGEGVVVVLDRATIERNVPFHVLLVNQGPVSIFLDPCYVAGVQFEEPPGSWKESWIPQAQHPACDPEHSPLWPLPPGSGTAVAFTVDVPGTYRVQVPYRLGCEQGVVRNDARCATGVLAANTMVFEVP